MTDAKKRQRGVSLLEALIAVALLAALASMLAPAMHNALRLSTITLRDAEARESHRIAEDALSQILSKALLIDPGELDLRITGDDARLRVASLAGSATARRFSLQIENGRLTGDIETLLGEGNENETTEILAAGAIGFSYYGRATPDAPLGWTSKWSGALPPALVRLQMRESDGPDAITSIEIPVNVRGPLHCAFDPVSRRCRD
jgi:general secretion pathway protein J